MAAFCLFLNFVNFYSWWRQHIGALPSPSRVRLRLRKVCLFLLLIVFLLLFFMLLCCRTDKNKQEKTPQTFVSVINIYRAFIWLFHNVVWRHFPVCGCVLINLYCVVICSCLLFSQPRVTVVNVFYSSRTADVFCTNYALCKFIKPFVVFSRYISILLCLNHDSISGSR